MQKVKETTDKHILSDEGIAMVGYKVGDIIQWPSKKGNLKLEILNVEDVEDVM